jgi:hypothetical protein
MEEHIIEYKKWIYKVKENRAKNSIKLEILPDIQLNTPIELCKYFDFKDYNVDLITGKYFYGSHPFDLNDPFDLNKNMLKLDSKIMNELYEVYFSRFGILSMTENDLDPLMWSHYGSHRGFVIKYKINKILINFFGPFPINYIDDFDPIESENKLLTLLVASNIKFKEFWQNEKEWRFILFSPNMMKLPNFIQKKLNINRTRKRYFKYRNDFSIKEIIMGYKLILNDRVRILKYDSEIMELTTKDDLIIRFLSTIHKSEINTYLINLHPSEYSRFIKQKVLIKPIGRCKFIFNFS